VFIDVSSGERYDVEAKTKSRALSGRCSHFIWKKRMSRDSRCAASTQPQTSLSVQAKTSVHFQVGGYDRLSHRPPSGVMLIADVSRKGTSSRLLAHSGHRLLHCACPVSGVKRTCLFARVCFFGRSWG